MEKQTSSRKPLVVGIIAAVLVLAALLVVLLTQCAPNGSGGASVATTEGKPVIENVDLYWNVDRALYDGKSEGGMSSRRVGKDGYFHIRFFKDGEFVELKAETRNIVNKLEVRDVMGLVVDGDVIQDVIPIEDMPVQKMGWKFYVQSVGGHVIKVNSSNKFDGMEVLLEAKGDCKVYDMTGTMGEVGCETTAVQNDRVMAVADMEGNLLVVYIYDRSNMVVEFQAYCQHCDQEVTWQEWSNEKQVPVADGHYKLVTDVQLSGQRSIQGDAKICLDLNGHTVHGKEGSRMYSIHNLNAELAIMDTSEEQNGKLAAHGEIYAQGTVVWARNGNFYLYSGILDASDAQCTGRGGTAVYIAKDRFFYMYGGEIVGGTAKCYYNEDSGQWVNGVGGNLYILGKFVMKDGVIRDGKALSTPTWANGKVSYKRGLGGNIFAGSGSEIVMDGGTIQNGSAGASGNIYLDGTAEFTMNGGTISGGYVTDPGREGGNLNMGAKATFTMNGGVISWGTGRTTSGNIYVAGTFNMHGGLITGGRVINKEGKADADAPAANMYLTTGSKLNMYGGTIHGRVAAKDGTKGNAKQTSIVLSGMPIIYDEKATSNLSLLDGTEPVRVQVNGLYKLAKIGVTASGKFTLETKEEYGKNFISDIEEAEILYVDKRLAVGKMACLCGSETQTHIGDCDGKEMLWGPWTTANGLPTTPGNYYLVKNVAYTKNKSLGGKDSEGVINLDLNGKTITSQERAITTYYTLNIADHKGGGQIIGAGISSGEDHTGVVMVFTNRKMNLYGGTLKLADEHYSISHGGVLGVAAGAEVNVYAGTLDGRANSEENMGVITDGGTVRIDGTVNIHGGKIYGGKVAKNGGTFLVQNKGKLNVLGGEILGGNASNGGAIHLTGKNAAVTVSGGTISGGVTQGKGGNINVSSGTLTVSGGKILDGSSIGNGGNISATGGKVVVSGGLISGGKVKDSADNHTANIVVQNAAMEFSGGQVDGGLLILNTTEENKASIVLSGEPVVTRPNTFGLRLFAVAPGTEPDVIIDGELGEKASIEIDATEVFSTETVAVNEDKFIPADELDTIHFGEDKCLFVGRVHCKCEDGKADWCDHKLVRWSKWNGKTNLQEGNYYLTADVALQKNLSIGAEGKTLNICLNGHTVSGSNCRVMNVNGTVNIFDHSEGKGTLTSTGMPEKETEKNGVITKAPDHSAVAVVFDKAVLNIYGGNFVLAEKHNNLSDMGGVMAIAAGAKVNMYGGKVDASASLTSENTIGSGGAIRVDGELNVYGGQIIGGKVTGNGGAILLRSDTAKVNIEGGTICGGEAVKGGNIMVNAGSLTVSGGEILNGKATQGGNIALQAPSGSKISNFTVSGGIISGGTADASNNANLYVNNTTMKLTGGKIDGGVTVVRTASGNAWVEISGDPQINATDKTNLRLVGAGGTTAPEVKIVGELTGGENTIGITAPVGAFASGAVSADAKVFYDDSAKLGVAYNDSKLYLGQLRCFCGAAQGEAAYDSVAHTDWCDTTMGLGIWQPWDGKTGLTEGNYYLTGDAQIGKDLTMGEAGKILNISLDGHTITAKDCRVFKVNGDLSILDHGTGDGMLVSTGVPVKETEKDGVITKTLDHSVIAVVYADAKLNLYGGTLKLADDYNALGELGGMVSVVAGATMNIYDGVIDASASLNSSTEVLAGGALRVDGQLNIYGGQILGGKVTGNGGAILLRSATAVVNVAGGTITGGEAKNGGAIYVKAGELNVSDGVVTGGTSNGNGGAIYVQDGALNVSGGLVEKGEAMGNNKGGNIMLAGGSLNISGGEVKAGTAQQGGNIAVQVAKDHTINNVTISGGTISGGTARQNTNNANLYVSNAVLKLSGGVIDGGVSVVCSNGTQAWVEISGNPEIKAADKTNLRLVKTGSATQPVVKVVGALTGNAASVGITAPEGLFATDAVAENSPIFFDDAATLGVVLKDNSLYLARIRCFCGAAEGVNVTYDSASHSAWCDATMGMTAWWAWDGKTAFTESGNYYLTGAVKDATNKEIKGLTINLDLMGNTYATASRSFNLLENATLGIMNGTIVGKGTAKAGAAGLFSVNASTLNLYSGTYKLAAEHNNITEGGIVAGGNAPTINIYEATLDGASTSGTVKLGGVIRINGGTLNIKGGVINGRAVTENGGTIYVKDGTVNISGGTVNGGSAVNGGTIYMEKGALNVSGGTVYTGKVTAESAEQDMGCGAAVYMADGTAQFTGGELKAYTTDAIGTRGGILYVGGGKATIDGAVITGGKVIHAGSIFVAAGELEMLSGTVTGGESTSTSSQGGSIYVKAGATFTLLGGEVKNGVSKKNGGNIAVHGTLVLGGDAQVHGGTGEQATSGNIYIQNATLIVSGAPTVDGGISAISSNATGSTVKISGTPNFGNYLNLGRTSSNPVPVIQITGALTDGTNAAKITVRLGNTNTGLIAQSTGDYTMTDADKACFTSANAAYGVRANGNDVELYKRHLHCWCENAIAAPDHTCNDMQEWTEISKTSTLDDGYYYLSKNLNGSVTVAAGKTAYLCLNGSLLKAQDVIKLQDGATLYICDCGTDGEITTTKNSLVKIAEGQTVYLMSGKLNGTNGTVSSRIAVEVNGGTFYMYGGQLADGCKAVAQVTDATKKETGAGMGGNLYITGGNAYIYGGTISGGMLGDTACDVIFNDGTLTVGGDVNIGSVKIAEGKTITIGSALTCADQTIGIYAGHGLFATGAVAADAAKFKNLSGTQEYPVYVAEGQLHMAVQSCLCGAASGPNANYDAVTHTEWCGKSGGKLLLWEPWDGTTAITNGNYYLTDNGVELNVGVCEIAAGNQLNLSLNGNSVKHIGSTRAFNVKGTLNITDWTATPGAVSGKGKANDQSAVAFINGGTLNLCRGTLKLADDHNALGANGGVMAIANGGTVNIYEDGCVDASASLTSGKAITNGAAIRVSAKLNIYGGTVIGGKVDSLGGAIYMKDDTAVVHIENGTVTAGDAAKGDAICLANGTLSLEGNVSLGEIYVSAGKSFVVKDGMTATTAIPVFMGENGLFAKAEDGKTLTYAGKTRFVASDSALDVACYAEGYALTAGPVTCACGKTAHDASCSQLDLVIEPWVDDEGNAITDELPTTSGNYYLTAPVAVSAGTEIGADQDVKLWLEGNNVTVKSGESVNPVITLKDGAKLTLSDTTGTGTIIGAVDTKQVIRLDKGELTIDGANVDASAIAVTTATNGLAVYVNQGTFNLKDGTITGGSTTHADSLGGAVYLTGNGTMYMYDGLVTGGTATNGGNIAMRGKLYMSGGEISDGNATTSGGNIYVYDQAAALAEISGGKITDGSAKTGGNVAACGAFSMLGGTVSGGNCTDKGGNIFIDKIANASVLISGGTVTAGMKNEAATDRGNVAAMGGTLKLTGGEIHGGVFAMDGGTTIEVSGDIKVDKTLDTASKATADLVIAKSSSNKSFSTVDVVAAFTGEIYIEGNKNVAEGTALVTGVTSQAVADCFKTHVADKQLTYSATDKTLTWAAK